MRVLMINWLLYLACAVSDEGDIEGGGGGSSSSTSNAIKAIKAISTDERRY